VDIEVSANSLVSRLDAVERVVSKGRVRQAQLIPIRVISRNKLTRGDRLLSRRYCPMRRGATSTWAKSIFTVKHLSYIFRPRRRPKKFKDKREKYHHSLKALALREKKLHIVGKPQLKIEGTPVYLDVEGIPDRNFYYLIGLRTANADDTLQYSIPIPLAPVAGPRTIGGTSFR